MDPIIAQWTWTQEDLDLGRKFFRKTVSKVRQFWTWAIISASVTFVILNEIAKGGREAGLFVFGILLFAVLGSIFVTTTFISPFLRKREFAKRPDANIEIRWEITAEKIVITTDLSRSEMEWSIFYKVISVKAGFLFLPNAQIFQFIPNRAFAVENDIQRLRQLAALHAKDYKEFGSPAN